MDCEVICIINKPCRVQSGHQGHNSDTFKCNKCYKELFNKKQEQCTKKKHTEECVNGYNIIL